MRILFTGPLGRGETAAMRRDTLVRMGHDVEGVDLTPFVEAEHGLGRKLQWHSRSGRFVRRYNAALTAAARGFDLFWVEKGVFVWPETIAALREAGVHTMVHYSPDNYFIRQNTSRHVMRALPQFDVVVTTKTANVARLRALGLPCLLSGNAYDPEVHRPVELTSGERTRFESDVCFVGRWELEREQALQRVAEMGVRLAIWGTQWERARAPGVRAAFRGGPALADDYARVISGASISLAFLSRIADDRITQRSVEIPACGGFMLAERTEEHRQHFQEDVEAVYFDGTEELCAKVERYLEDAHARVRIAEAGRVRCTEAGYSYARRIEAILQDGIRRRHAIRGSWSGGT